MTGERVHTLRAIRQRRHCFIHLEQPWLCRGIAHRAAASRTACRLLPHNLLMSQRGDCAGQGFFEGDGDKSGALPAEGDMFPCASLERLDLNGSLIDVKMHCLMHQFFLVAIRTIFWIAACRFPFAYTCICLQSNRTAVAFTSCQYFALTPSVSWMQVRQLHSRDRLMRRDSGRHCSRLQWLSCGNKFVSNCRPGFAMLLVSGSQKGACIVARSQRMDVATKPKRERRRRCPTCCQQRTPFHQSQAPPVFETALSSCKIVSADMDVTHWTSGPNTNCATAHANPVFGTSGDRVMHVRGP